MSPTIFFSYSRENSETVLELAKELRGAGANIWLDQLDIEPALDGINPSSNNVLVKITY